MVESLNTTDTFSINVQNIPKVLENCQQQFGDFSDALISCFSQYEVNNQHFLGLRNDIVIDCLIYVKGVAPIVKKVLAKTKFVFDTVNAMELEEFKADIENVKEDFNDIKICLQFMIDLHDIVSQTSVQRGIQASKVVTALKELNDDMRLEIAEKEAEFENVKKELKEKAGFLAKLNPFSSESEISKAHKLEIAIEKKQLQQTAQTLFVVEKILHPALKKYLNTIQNLQQIFSVLHSEVETGNNAAGQATRRANQFKVLKTSCTKISDSCASLTAFYVKVESEVKAMKREMNKPVQTWIDIFADMKKNQQNLLSELIAIESAFTRMDILDGTKKLADIKEAKDLD